MMCMMLVQILKLQKCQNLDKDFLHILLVQVSIKRCLLPQYKEPCSRIQQLSWETFSEGLSYKIHHYVAIVCSLYYSSKQIHHIEVVVACTFSLENVITLDSTPLALSYVVTIKTPSMLSENMVVKPNMRYSGNVVHTDVNLRMNMILFWTMLWMIPPTLLTFGNYLLHIQI